VVKRYAKNPVGAHYGLRPWLLQRLTAVVMGLYTVVLVASLLVHPIGSQAELRALFAGGFFRVATLLAFTALLYHAWVGLCDIFMDYVKPVWMRVGLEVAVALVLLGYFAWAATILWGLPAGAAIGAGR
jgi:succinate dehydrogenase / fumarate reductase, membrane anchor subunit